MIFMFVTQNTFVLIAVFHIKSVFLPSNMNSSPAAGQKRVCFMKLWLCIV